MRGALQGHLTQLNAIPNAVRSISFRAFPRTEVKFKQPARMEWARKTKHLCKRLCWAETKKVPTRERLRGRDYAGEDVSRTKAPSATAGSLLRFVLLYLSRLLYFKDEGEVWISRVQFKASSRVISANDLLTCRSRFQRQFVVEILCQSLRKCWRRSLMVLCRDLSADRRRPWTNTAKALKSLCEAHNIIWVASSRIWHRYYDSFLSRLKLPNHKLLQIESKQFVDIQNMRLADKNKNKNMRNGINAVVRFSRSHDHCERRLIQF